MPNNYSYDWSDLAFASKKPVSSLDATFIAAPREISAKRLTQLVKEYLPKGNIVLGLAKEQFVDGFDGQAQFRTLQQETVQPLLDKLYGANTPNNVYILRYQQRELQYIVEKISFKHVILVNGSWQSSFHVTPAFYSIIKKGVPYSLVSPFTDVIEAKLYAAEHDTIASYEVSTKKLYNTTEMLQLANDAAKLSFDYTFQTGAVLGKPDEGGYIYLAYGVNRVVPYQTYAMHAGASREQNFSPPNDANHYDTIHAEVDLLLKVLKHNILLAGTTLFINLLPCPSCARMLSQTDIAEIIYTQDHSDGYAVKMLELAGKKVIRASC